MDKITYDNSSWALLAFTSEDVALDGYGGSLSVRKLLEDEDDLIPSVLNFDLATGNYRDYISGGYTIRHPRLSFISLLMSCDFEPAKIMDGEYDVRMHVGDDLVGLRSALVSCREELSSSKSDVDALCSDAVKLGYLYRTLNREVREEGFTEKYEALNAEIFKMLNLEKPRTKK